LTRLPPDLERLRSRLLRESGFKDIEAPSGMIAQRRAAPKGDAEYFATATSFLVSYHCDPFTRQMLELHVDGMKNRAIARKLKTYRKLVDARVNRFKRAMAGMVPIRGRPRKPDGYGEGSLRITVRLDDDEAAALVAIEDGLGVNRRTAVRLALKAQAKTISVDKKVGAK